MGAQNPVILILGKGRSGTSAMAGALALCGCALPERLLGPHSGNPKGHFEPMEGLLLNHEFLMQHGSNYYDPSLRLQTEFEISERDKSQYLEGISELLKAWPDGLLVIKEPRISILVDFWTEALRRIGRPLKVIIMVRAPGEVVASLRARDNTSNELGQLLWLKFNLLVERQTRALPRIFVEYSSLLSDWRRQILRIAK